MSDLSSMIDATTERLLRKIDNWEVPQSDKKHVTIKRTNDLYEQNQEYIDTIAELSRDKARLQKQLEIAVEGLNEYAKPHNVNMYEGGYTISMGHRYLSDNGKVARKYLQRIEELNK